MTVFVVGASGAIGARLVPQLVERGHEVVGSCRSRAKSDRLRALGAEPVVLDALDGTAVRSAVAAARPEAIVHQAAALADLSDFKPPQHFPRVLARLLAGDAQVVMGTESRGASNAAAKRELGWTFAAPQLATGLRRRLRDALPADVLDSDLRK